MTFLASSSRGQIHNNMKAIITRSFVETDNNDDDDDDGDKFDTFHLIRKSIIG